MSETTNRWWSSRTAVLVAVGVIVAIGLFVAGILIGSHTSGPTSSATSSPALATTTTSVSQSCSTSSAGCLAFISSDTASAVAGVPFSFTVTTKGPPVNRFRKDGRLPRGVRFLNNHDGTATLSGTPVPRRRRSAVGTYPLTFTAISGTGKDKQIVSQAFTLIVAS